MRSVPEILAELFERGWCNPFQVGYLGWAVVIIAAVVIWKTLGWLASLRVG